DRPRCGAMGTGRRRSIFSHPTDSAPEYPGVALKNRATKPHFLATVSQSVVFSPHVRFNREATLSHNLRHASLPKGRRSLDECQNKTAGAGAAQAARGVGSLPALPPRLPP